MSINKQGVGVTICHIPVLLTRVRLDDVSIWNLHVRYVCSTAYTQLPGNCIAVGNLLYLAPGTKYMTKYWLNVIKYVSSISKTTKYMSKTSSNVSLSESKKQRQTTRRDGGAWGEVGWALRYRGDI